MDSRPQREIHSPKPASQPRPPRSVRLTNWGWTISKTGESQPRRRSPALAVQILQPRVGTTVKFIAPLSTSTMSTPSCRPPANLRFVTLHLSVPESNCPVWWGSVLRTDRFPGYSRSAHLVGGKLPLLHREV